MARHAYEATHRLPFLKTPTLILVGSSDMADGGAHFPASKMLADRIPGSEMKIMNGVSHGFFWENPDMAAEVLETWFRLTAEIVMRVLASALVSAPRSPVWLPAKARTPAEFYRDKQVKFVVSSSVGGGFDTATRLIARHLQKPHAG